MRQLPGKSFARNRKLRLAFCLLAFRAATTAQTDAPPDAAEQERILALMRQYAASYGMPDVAFDKTITTFEGRAASNKWHKVWTGDSNRIAHDQREYWRFAGKGGEPLTQAKWNKAGLYDNHCFRVLATKAVVVWDHWDTLRARRFAVFDYRVSQQDSEWIEMEPGVAPARLPYSGSIHVDPATGAIWRYTEVVTEIPARLALRYASGITDFDQVAIGTAQYLLPMTLGTIRRSYGHADTRDEFVCRNYHKFDADSSITFFGADSSITYKK